MSQIFTTSSDYSNLNPNELSNYTYLLKENIELRSQKKELVSHIKRNEDLLFKAQKIINSLREEMTHQSEHSIKSKSLQISDDRNVLELQDKLYISNKSLQETILRINESNSQLKTMNEQNLQMERDLHKTKKELEYSQKIIKKFMTLNNKKEKSVDFSMNKLFEENCFLKEQLSEYNSSSYSVLKKTENKIENLELNLTKIEETSLILPEIEQKVNIFQRQTSQKFYLIEKSADCISNQFEFALNNFSDSPFECKQDFHFFELNEKELTKLDKNLLIILKKLDFSQDLQRLFEFFCKEILSNFEKNLEKKFVEAIMKMENKINKILNFVSIIEMKKEIKKEFLEKRGVIKGKSQDFDFKNSTFGKNMGFFIDEDKENLNSGNLNRKNDRNLIENLMRKLEDYKVNFQNFYEDLSVVLKGISQNKFIKAEEAKMLKGAIDGRSEMARDLEKFILNMNKNIDYLKIGVAHSFKDSKHLPLRV